MGEDGAAVVAATATGPAYRTSGSGAALPLFGRVREEAALAARLMAALDGQGGLALIAGEAGIGKTALAEAICREGTGRGAWVGAGRSADVMEAPPFAVWREAISALPGLGVAPEIALPPALAPFGPRPEARGPAGVFAAVRDMLAALAARTPLVLLLDDLHWTDAASLDLLRFLAPSLPTLPLLVLATYRADELDDTHPLHTLVPALVREADALPLALAPLTDADVRALVAARYALPAREVARLVPYLQRRAGGNPFYLGELLRTLEETRMIHASANGWAVADLTAAPVPLLVRHLIAARVARLDLAARDLLPVAATIGADVPLVLWAQTAGVAEEALLPVIAAATRVGILTADPDGTRIRFRHALIRDALYESALPPRRRAWHRAAAEAIIATPHPDPDAAAHHFRQAGDPRTAIWLYYAGARAVAAAAYTDGIARYMEAQALLPPTIWGGGPFATDADNRTLAAHLRFDRGLAYALMGELRAAFADMEAALTTLEARPVESGALSALLEDLNVPRDRRGMATTWLAYVGRFTAAEAVATRLLADPTTHGTRRGWKTRGDSLNALMIVRAARGDAAGAWQASLAARAALETAAMPLLLSGFAEQALLAVALPYFADDLPRRDALAAEAETARHRAGAMAAGLPPGFGRLPLLFVEGAWGQAWDVAMPVRTQGVGGWRAETVTSVLAPLALARGDITLATALVREGLPDGVETVPTDAFYATALILQRVAAMIALDTGDYPTARAWLAAHDRWLAWAGATLGRAEGALGWAAYHRAMGDFVRAEATAQAALRHASTPRQPLVLLAAHRTLGELATAMRRDGDAATHLDAALTLADACAAPYERAQTLLALAALSAVQGKRAAATAQVEESLALATSLGAAPLVNRAEALAVRLARSARGRRPSAHPAGLSDQEIAVLRLLAQGCTNREIATTLSLTPGTVATYVRHIFTKTDSANRTAAAAFARRHGIT